MAQIAENEACYQVMMLSRRQPTLWRRIYKLRQAGYSWVDTLADLRLPIAPNPPV